MNGSKKRPLLEHVDDWHASLIAKGNTTDHADRSKSLAISVFGGCRFNRWDDISASAVQTWVGDRRAAGISAQTANHTLQAVKGFCRWMVKDRRAPGSPLAHLAAYNLRTDRRHDRRPFTVDELTALLTATRAGRKHNRMTGEQRAMLYRLASETGLRASDIRSLRRSDFSTTVAHRHYDTKSGGSRAVKPPISHHEQRLARDAQL